MIIENQEARPQARPECMVALGLSPPYSVEDVKQAYFIRAKTAHPDAGGNEGAFRRLYEAYEQAMAYVHSRPDSQAWIRAQVERYLDQVRVIRELERRGGRVEIETLDWLSPMYGEDFAHLVDRIVGVTLSGPQFGDRDVEYLVAHRSTLGNLQRLDLSRSKVSDDGLGRLGILTTLQCLDLHDTRISRRGLDVLRYLPTLRSVDLRGTRVGWWRRLRLRRRFRQAKVAANGPGFTQPLAGQIPPESS